jgi:hypothetical protein
MYVSSILNIQEDDFIRSMEEKIGKVAPAIKRRWTFILVSGAVV